jgi:hypothetical protein
MEMALSADKPSSVFIAGGMREPDRNLWLIADWTFEILELAPFGCDRKAGDPRDSLTIRDFLMLLQHSHQPHPGEFGGVDVEGNRLGTSSDMPGSLDQAIWKLCLRRCKTAESLRDSLMPFNHQLRRIEQMLKAWNELPLRHPASGSQDPNKLCNGHKRHKSWRFRLELRKERLCNSSLPKVILRKKTD